MTELTEHTKNKIRHDVDLFVQGDIKKQDGTPFKSLRTYIRLKYAAHGITGSIGVAQERLRELKVLGYGDANELI